MNGELLLPDALQIVADANSNAHPSRVQPTVTAYSELMEAFEVLNHGLFGAALSDPLFVMARAKGRLGHFAPDRFECTSGQHAHEIGVNPAFFQQLGPMQTLSVLAHELAHHWRHDFGALNRRGGKGSRGYHDLIWHQKMVELGLPPIYARNSTGAPNKYRVSNEILPGGRFDVVARRLIGAGFGITWYDTLPALKSKPNGRDGETKRGMRLRYDCRTCSVHVWGKSGIRLVCGDCHAPMSAYLPPLPKGGHSA